jgi:hypothetical protein
VLVVGYVKGVPDDDAEVVEADGLVTVIGVVVASTQAIMPTVT